MNIIFNQKAVHLTRTRVHRTSLLLVALGPFLPRFKSRLRYLSITVSLSSMSRDVPTFFTYLLPFYLHWRRQDFVLMWGGGIQQDF